MLGLITGDGGIIYIRFSAETSVSKSLLSWTLIDPVSKLL